MNEKTATCNFLNTNLFTPLKLGLVFLYLFTKLRLMSKPIRVVQVIDSLDPGGSEKMAVQLANALVSKVELSALVCTRKTGALKHELSDGVLNFTAHKKNTCDLNAFIKLRTFVKSNRINIIHAHSSSFFWCTLLKLSCPKIKLIWHDHFGNRSKTSKKNNIALYFSSFHFNHIITVNQDLKYWASKHLNCKTIDYLTNFTLEVLEIKSKIHIKLKGDANAFKLIHIANLRPVKDHLTALMAIQILINQKFNITYHGIGDYNSKSEYFQSVKSFIENNNLESNVFLYGSQSGIPNILSQADLGLLSSVSEGLPVSLLEYINAELPVVVTDVGQCKEIVGKLGHVVDPQNDIQLANAIEQILKNKDDAKQKAIQLKQNISETYGSEKILKQLIDIYALSLQTS